MIELKPHQQEALRKMKNGCILCGDVGVGKTFTALQYYLENDAPKDIFVITTAKVRDSLDWESSALRVGITPDRETTLASVISVDSWNNIGKYTEVKDAFFIFDEQKVIGSGAWVKAFYEITKHNRWIILSATPGDVWLDYAPVFIANGFYKNITQFRTEHVEYVPRVSFPKVKRYHKVGKLVRLRNQILVDMPFERHTERVSITVPVEYDRELLQKVVKDRWHVYEDRPLRDVSELFAVMRKVVNSDVSRLDAIKSLLKTHPKVIVFYNHNYELEMLRTLASSTKSDDSSNPWDYLLSPEGMRENDTRLLACSGIRSQTVTKKSSSLSVTSSIESSVKESDTATPLAVAEWNGHKHEPIPTTDRWVYLVQYRAGAEGWNCITTDTVVFYTPTYSYKDDHQAHGRIDRLTTPFLTLYYYRLLSEAVTDKWVMESLAAKKSFNEAAIRRKMQGFTDLAEV